MNAMTEKCRQCFAPDADVAQDVCIGQTTALQLFNALHLQDRAPVLCQSADRRYRVCHQRSGGR